MVDSIKYTDYDLLRRRVIANPTSIRNMTDLALWFELFGIDFWNGEYWDADGYSLRPIFEYDPITDQQNTIGYEWREI